MCVMTEYLDLKQGRLSQVRYIVKYATNESSTTFKLTSYLPLLLGLATMYLLGGDKGVHVRYSAVRMYLRQSPFYVVWCMYIGCSLRWNDRMVGQVTDEREEKKKRGKSERMKEGNE